MTRVSSTSGSQVATAREREEGTPSLLVWQQQKRTGETESAQALRFARCLDWWREKDSAAMDGGHNRVYRYFFAQVAESDPAVAPLGSFHTLEVMWVFAGWNRYVPSESEIALSNAMRSYWSGISDNGNPSYVGGVRWPLFNVKEAPYLELAGTIAAKRGDVGAHCDFWDMVGGYAPSRHSGNDVEEPPE